MKGLKLLAVVGVLFVLPVAAFQLMRGKAPTPGVFDPAVTLAAAIEKSKATGEPIVAFATADWCGPCQVMKRETLVDTRVVNFLGSRAIPVYVNIDHDKAAAGMLRVTSIPTTVVIAGDTIVAKTSGVLTPEDYLSFLESAVDLAASPAEIEKLRDTQASRVPR